MSIRKPNGFDPNAVKFVPVYTEPPLFGSIRSFCLGLFESIRSLCSGPFGQFVRVHSVRLFDLCGQFVRAHSVPLFGSIYPCPFGPFVRSVRSVCSGPFGPFVRVHSVLLFGSFRVHSVLCSGPFGQFVRVHSVPLFGSIRPLCSGPFDI